MTEKQILRDRFREHRRSLTDEEYRSRTRLILDRARELPEYAGARVVHAYWPGEIHREIDTRPLLDELARRNVRVILPVVQVFGPPTGEPRLSHAVWEPDTEMRANRWGIPEPMDRRPSPVDDVDLILVPALACDLRGVRLGHGYGYYDEFLAQAPGVRLCLCMEDCLVDSLPAAPHDEQVDIVVTEARTIRTEHGIMP